MKKCCRCGVEKPQSEFHNDASQKSGLCPRCKTCESARKKTYYDWGDRNFRERKRRNVLKACYGISIDEYQRLLSLQNGVCAICGAPPSGRFKYLAVDHNHLTGEVRGLLCNSCNRALGLLKDDFSLLQAAVAYMKQTPTNCEVEK